MPISKRQAMILTSIVACTVGVFLLLFVRITPPTCGRVVDATTGRPVGNIEVILQVSSIERWGSPDTQVAHRTSTAESGWFVLMGTFSWNIPFVRDFQSSWLTVNAEQSGYVVGDEGSASLEIRYDPMFNLLRGEPVGNKQYFPVAVTFRPDGCARVWDAACLYRKFWLGLSIPLVPVLNDVEDCNKIGDSTLRERCRQLNTYRAAFVQVDTYEEVKKGKEFCKRLSSAELSKTCLGRLSDYIGLTEYARPIKHRQDEPIPDGMFPDSLSGLPVMNNKRCWPRDVFSGRVMCTSGYGTTARQLVAVSIEQWPDTENPRKLLESRHVENQTNVTEEERRGGRVMRFQGKWYSEVQRADGSRQQYQHKTNSFVWWSGDRLVDIFFYDPISEQERFVSYYLGRFPSSLNN